MELVKTGNVIPDIWERDGFYRTLLHHQETMLDIFKHSAKRTDYIDHYPDGVPVIPHKESWRLQAEQWIAEGRYQGHYMFGQWSSQSG